VHGTTDLPPHLRKLGGNPPLSVYLASIWRRREFAWNVALGELRSQHLDTALGNLWHLINPILLISVYYLVFGVVLGTDRGVDNFLAFLAIGVFTFNYLQKAILGGGRTLISNVGLIRSLQFPRALLPISATLRETMAFWSATLVMVAAVVLTGEPLTWTWLALLPSIALATVFAMGLSFVAARLADRFRDLLNVLPFLFRIAFYLSGVLYSVDAYINDPRILRALLANPFYVFISLPREYLMASQEHDFVGWMWLSAVAWAAGSFVVGMLLFRAGEREYGRG
jgi:teichoic acid transport system permease protein